MSSGELVRSAVPSVAILLLMGSLYLYHGEMTRLSERALALQGSAQARALRGELLGGELGWSQLAGLSGERDGFQEGSGLRVVWFVDPKRCIGCLDDLSGWRRLDDPRRVGRTLILVGTDAERAAKVRRALSTTGEVRWTPDVAPIPSVPRERMPPFLLLLLGPQGEILAAEVGNRMTDCQRSPFEHVEGLVEAVRPSPGSKLASTADAVSSD